MAVEESLFRGQCRERGGLRARPRSRWTSSATAPRCRKRNPIRRATFLRETHPYPSLLRYCLSKVVSTSARQHRTDVRAMVPAVQVRGECSLGAKAGNKGSKMLKICVVMNTGKRRGSRNPTVSPATEHTRGTWVSQTGESRSCLSVSLRVCTVWWC